MEFFSVIMSFFRENLLSLLAIPFKTWHPFCVLYLIPAFILTVFIYIKREREEKSFSEFCLPRGYYSHPSTRIDYWIILINQFTRIHLVLVIFTSLELGILLQNILTIAIPSPQLTPSTVTLIVFNLAALFAYDFGKFLCHYYQHRNWSLWAFHKVHHSAQVLTPFAVFRFHPIDRFMNGLFVAFFMGVNYGFFFWLFGRQLELVHVLSLPVGIFLFYITTYNLRHSYIWLAFPKWLSYVMISPAQHQVHHSIEAKHLGKNLGHIFAFWDLMFGTLYIPEKKEVFTIGLNTDEDKLFEKLFNIYILPFKQVGQKTLKKFQSKQQKKQ